MNCPECKQILEEMDFDLNIGCPMPQMLSVVAQCTECNWTGCAVTPIEGFMSYDGLDPETAA